MNMREGVGKKQAFEEWAMSKPAQMQSAQQGMQAVQQYEAQLVTMQDTASIPDPTTGQVAPPEIPPPPSLTQFTPLAWKPWYHPVIHKQEFMKWANSDRMVELLKQNPALEKLLIAHLQEINDAAIALQAVQQLLTNPGSQAPGAQGSKGSAQAMRNSNSESGGSQNASDHTARPQEGV